MTVTMTKNFSGFENNFKILSIKNVTLDTYNNR
jgi:hypothetical protein